MNAIDNDNRLIDFHTHILPGIDDGSRDLAETVRLLQEESQQNVDCVVATPHFYADRFSVEEFLTRREHSLKTVVKDLMPGAPKLYTGAEVYYFPGMGRAEKLPSLCIKGTDVILIEMPFVQWREDMLRDLREVLNRQNLRIVLAHVERYPQFQKDQRIWREVMDLPLTIQINAGSFLKGRSRRKMCLELLQRQDRALLGSDCHNMSMRTPNLAKAREVIAKKSGRAMLEHIDRIAQSLLEDAIEIR